MQLSETAPGIETMDVSLPDFDLWRSRTTSFTGMFAFDDAAFLLTSPDRPEILQGALVSPGFLTVLGVDPVLGRGFAMSEERPGADDVVMISDALWERRYGRDPGILGVALDLSGSTRRIVGVAPPGFHFPEVAHAWIPLAFEATEADPEDYGYDVVARLKPEVDLEAAMAEGRLVAAELAARWPEAKAGIGVTAYPLRAADIPLALGASVLALLGAVLMVMLVACTNVSSLLLARGEERRDEMAVRRAMGAGAGRMFRQFLTESGVLVAFGVAGALLVGVLAVDFIPGLLPEERPFWIRFDLDVRVFAWSLAMGALACGVIAIPPAIQAAGSGGTGSPRGGRVLSGRSGRWLIGAQIALATVLVGGAGLASRSLLELHRIEPGVQVEGVLVAGGPIPRWSYPDAAARRAFMREALESVRALPGVVSAAAVDAVPLLTAGSEVALDGGGEPGDRAPVGLLNAFSDGYFETMGIPVLEGRVPRGPEVWGEDATAVVSASLARRLWGEEEAVGRRIRHGVPGSRSPSVADDQPWLTVAAVVGDVHQSGPGRTAREELYLPIGAHVASSLTMVVRTSGPPLGHAEAVRRAVHRIDPGFPFYEPTTMADARRFSVWTERMLSLLLASFGGLATTLAVIGVYGVVAHTTRLRTPEMGLRVAVGASRAEIQGLVLRESLRLLWPGLVVGLGLAALASVFLRRVLFGVGVLDPPTLVFTATLFVGAGLLASWLPARRSAGVDPAAALRA